MTVVYSFSTSQICPIHGANIRRRRITNEYWPLGIGRLIISVLQWSDVVRRKQPKLLMNASLYKWMLWLPLCYFLMRLIVSSVIADDQRQQMKHTLTALGGRKIACHPAKSKDEWEQLRVDVTCQDMPTNQVELVKFGAAFKWRHRGMPTAFHVTDDWATEGQTVQLECQGSFSVLMPRITLQEGLFI